MNNQEWWVTLLFFLLGHIGLAVRMFWVLITSGQKKLSVVDDYVEENSLVVVFGALCYYALVALWLWSDLFGLLGGVGDALGLIPKVLNAWTIPLAIGSDFILLKVVDKFGDKMGMDKLSDKIPIPKFSKPSDPQGKG